MNKRNYIYSIIFSVLFVIVLISGVTLAVYTWQTMDEDVIEGKSDCFNVIYVKGNDIGSNENMKKLSLGSTYKDGLSTTIKMNIDPKCDDMSGTGTLYLNTESDTSDYLINNGLLNYTVITNNSIVKSGRVNTKDSIAIYSGFDVNYDVKSIIVYVWLNGASVTNDNVEEVTNSVYKGNISANVEGR